MRIAGAAIAGGSAGARASSRSAGRGDFGTPSPLELP
jgi:hypothetical protein